MTSPKIIIIGAGPTGLGAAWRLRELNHPQWTIYERNSYVGGLAASFLDAQGFTWDIGGHVLFSHYEYFDRLLAQLLQGEYLEHLRESWIRVCRRWVPYPFQNNIRHLAPELIYECVAGLVDVAGRTMAPANFRDWLLATFGAGICRLFMEPYNRKVWAWPLMEMSYSWIGERVSVVDIKRVLKNIILGQDDVSWGPNNKFIFPLRGGTGEIFRRFLPFIKDRLYLDSEVAAIDPVEKKLRFVDGSNAEYDFLISTMPLDLLIDRMTEAPEAVRSQAMQLKHANGIIVGLGVRRPIDNNRCWMYFPEPENPCYRVTNFSNYSPHNVPGGDVATLHSLMGEISYSENKPVAKDAVVETATRGFIASGLLAPEDGERIISRFVLDMEYTYPIPTVERDSALKTIHAWLESVDIYSRGRFGGWKYEVGNMDHSTMQGVEIVDRLLLGKTETIYE